MKRKIGVFIGRFQPFHNGHLDMVKRILERVNRLVIVVGSSNSASSTKNPLCPYRRKTLIADPLRLSLGDKTFFNRVSLTSVADQPNDKVWVSAVDRAVREVITGIHDLESFDITLFGHNKDTSSYYLNLFPEWGLELLESSSGISATQIREAYYRKTLESIAGDVPYPVEWLDFNPELQEEYEYLEDYKKLWRDTPYPVNFVTSDAVVICNGHVLLIQRGASPGKGLLALPGGFVNTNETTKAASLRELAEETGLGVSGCMEMSHHVFDNPGRSLRGRVITHAYHYNIYGVGQQLPLVKAGDDASKAMWVPVREALRSPDKFHDDHFDILCHFVLTQGL